MSLISTLLSLVTGLLGSVLKPVFTLLGSLGL
jgi:hypothetical protein